jgi:hypothetical protein
MKQFLVPMLLAILAGCTLPVQGDSLTLAPGAVVLPQDEVDSADATGLNVQTDKDLKAGQVVISDEGDGLVRRITQVQTQSVQRIGAQVVRKVYIKTEDAGLEDAISEGTATLDPSELKFDDSSLVQSLPGVSVNAVSGTISLKNVTLNVAPGVTVKLSGTINQSLDPKFSLKFSGNKVSLFEAGVSGNIGASIQAAITTTGKATLAAGVEQQIARFAPIRSSFVVGAVPVVIVMEPRLVGGAKAGSDKAITVNAGIAPTLSFNAGVKYSPAGGWGNLYSGKPAFSAKLNPTFSYTTPGGVQSEAYAKLVIDVKFYGLLGPSIEVKPFANLAIAAATPTKADILGGLSASSKVVAGFKVLGKGMENEYPLAGSESSEKYACTTGGCAVAP